MIETRHAPLTAAELLQALKRPGSYWQTFFNAEVFLHFLDRKITEDEKIQWQQDRMREENELLNAILEATLRRTEASGAELRSPRLSSREALQQLSDEDPSGFRAALEEALEQCFDTLMQLNAAREGAWLEYEKIHQTVVDEMLVRAQENPLRRRDGTLVDIVEVLKQLPSLQGLARQMMESVLPSNQYFEESGDPVADLYPVLTPFSLVPRPTSRREEENDQDGMDHFVKKLNRMAEFQMLYVVNGGPWLDLSQILPSQREAVAYILAPLIANDRFAACRRNVFSLEASRCLAEARIQRLEEKIENLRTNQMRPY